MSSDRAPVVVPLAPSAAAFRLLADHAERLERAERVHLIHVVDPEQADDPAAQVAHARRVLGELARRHGLEAASVAVLEGPIGPVLRRYAESVRAGAILIPTPTGSPDGRGFLVSPVAEALVHRAPCPVCLLWARSDDPGAVAA